MINGMLEASRGCLKEEIRMDVISNNLSNATGIGFKKDRISFQQMLEDSATSQATASGTETEGVPANPLLVNIEVDMNEGDIQGTGNELDLAITGEGFFKINSADGVRYTRKGNFTVDANGNLTTQDGDTVMGKNGAINISGKAITVGSLGEIFIDGAQVDQLDIVNFDNTNVLVKDGSELFKNDSDAPEVTAGNDTSVKQGYVELSNVNMAEEMVNMIHCMRAFESYQKAIKVIDSLNDKAINQVGSLR
jgi:flagellar basal-body rod protein FlgF